MRRRRKGRLARPLSPREPLHVVFKARKGGFRSQSNFRSSRIFLVVQGLIRRYARRFFVKVEQISIQKDHIHLLIRAPRRSQFHFFFRVVGGQIAQQLEKEGWVTDTPQGFWLYRPFSRVVRGWKAYGIAVAYIQLNEKEAIGQIPYRKERLKGLSKDEWEILRV